MNVGGLMFLIMYIYAVLGVYTFAAVKDVEPIMHDKMNFRTIPSAMITLIKMATGENWNELIVALGEGYTITN